MIFIGSLWLYYNKNKKNSKGDDIIRTPKKGPLILGNPIIIGPEKSLGSISSLKDPLVVPIMGPITIGAEKTCNLRRPLIKILFLLVPYGYITIKAKKNSKGDDIIRTPKKGPLILGNPHHSWP